MIYETISEVLLMNREVSIRNDTERKMVIVTVRGFNKAQNLTVSHAFSIEDGKLPKEGELAEIIHLLNERIIS